jgi:hypothetical protein
MGVLMMMHLADIMMESERRERESRRKILSECTPQERVALEKRWEKERLEAVEERRHQQTIAALDRIASSRRSYYL